MSTEREQVEALAAHLDPTYCSESPGDGTYWRWVLCRCGWAGEKSQQAVNAPDMRRAHAEHLTSDVLAEVKEMADEWGLIVITSDGKTLLPEAEICKSREQAEERARQERSFGMAVVVASRRVTEWQPVGGDDA